MEGSPWVTSTSRQDVHLRCMDMRWTVDSKRHNNISTRLYGRCQSCTTNSFRHRAVLQLSEQDATCLQVILFFFSTLCHDLFKPLGLSRRYPRRRILFTSWFGNMTRAVHGATKCHRPIADITRNNISTQSLLQNILLETVSTALISSLAPPPTCHPHLPITCLWISKSWRGDFREEVKVVKFWPTRYRQ